MAASEQEDIFVTVSLLYVLAQGSKSRPKLALLRAEKGKKDIGSTYVLSDRWPLTWISFVIKEGCLLRVPRWAALKEHFLQELLARKVARGWKSNFEW